MLVRCNFFPTSECTVFVSILDEHALATNEKAANRLSRGSHARPLSEAFLRFLSSGPRAERTSDERNSPIRKCRSCTRYTKPMPANYECTSRAPNSLEQVSRPKPCASRSTRPIDRLRNAIFRVRPARVEIAKCDARGQRSSARDSSGSRQLVLPRCAHCARLACTESEMHDAIASIAIRRPLLA